jgi:putative PIN family toxin of toxin-antitoxin system
VIRAILDTNVILASLLSRQGASFAILQRLRGGEWLIVLSNHLVLEYEEVLKRNAGTLGLTLPEVDKYLNAICQVAECWELDATHPPRLPDLDDEPLLRLAEISGARLITTHNTRHLKTASHHGVAVLQPRDFLRMIMDHP